MVESGRVELLMHPLTQKYLEMKWQAYGMYIHLMNMFLYLLYLTMVTLFASNVLGHRPTGKYFSSIHANNTNINESEALNIPCELCDPQDTNMVWYYLSG